MTEKFKIFKFSRHNFFNFQNFQNLTSFLESVWHLDLISWWNAIDFRKIRPLGRRILKNILYGLWGDFLLENWIKIFNQTDCFSLESLSFFWVKCGSLVFFENVLRLHLEIEFISDKERPRKEKVLSRDFFITFSDKKYYYLYYARVCSIIGINLQKIFPIAGKFRWDIFVTICF